MAKRMLRRWAVATAFNEDVADVEEYQPGQTPKPIYQMGEGYAFAFRPGDKLPEGYNWKLREIVGNYEIYYAAPEVEAR